MSTRNIQNIIIFILFGFHAHRSKPEGLLGSCAAGYLQHSSERADLTVLPCFLLLGNCFIAAQLRTQRQPCNGRQYLPVGHLQCYRAIKVDCLDFNSGLNRYSFSKISNIFLQRIIYNKNRQILKKHYKIETRDIKIRQFRIYNK